MMSFEVARDINGSVMHDLVNVTLGSDESIPHEWFFLSVMSREEMLKHKEIAEPFVMFVSQYYPYYPWHFFKNVDYLATTVCECELKASQFQNKYEFKLDFDEY